MSTKTKESVFIIRKMCCPAEEQIIRNGLAKVQGIEELQFDLMEKQLTIRHVNDDTAIFYELEKLNMGVERQNHAHAEDGHAQKVSNYAKVFVSISGIAAIAAEITGWITGDENSVFVIGLSILSISMCGSDMFRKGFVALKTFTLNINFLMMIAIIGAMMIGAWPEAAMVAFLFALAELLEAYSLDRARNTIRGLMEMTPETALVKQIDGSWQKILSAKVAMGAIVRVKPGERIPLDGDVVSGQSTVNQAPITGESMPVEKKEGDKVFAGTINERGTFDFCVTANKGNTTLARIVRSVQEAQNQRAPTQRFVDQFARYYTPAVVMVAVLIAVIPPIFMDAAFVPWFYKALITLVVACPCALVISTPITVVSGLTSAAKQGILIKGGVYLEEGRKLKALALDKTGTLTKGKPQVTDIIAIVDCPEKEYLKLAASLESHSEHAVASAIATHAKTEVFQKIEQFESITGRGIKGRIDGILYYIGNHRLIEELGICSLGLEAVLERLEKEGKTVVILTTEKEPLCIFAVADTIRETSVQAIKDLQMNGVHCLVLTGDNQTTADAIGHEVGLQEVHGNMLPEDKLKAIEELRQKYGVVGMVGDGINDAPALAKASIGFAMGAAGTDTALETADVALMEDDLRRLMVFIMLSKKTGTILKQNISLAIGIKAIFLVLTLMGQTTLWMAVFADMGGSLIVVLNGLRLLRFGRSEVGMVPR